MRSFVLERALRCWAVLACLLAGLMAPAAQAAPADEAAIRAVMMATWDRPEARLLVAPVVHRGDVAIAGWVQGERGGRALLRRGSGGWQVTVCGGDGLKDVALLKDAGVDAAHARRLVAALDSAEKRLPAEQRRKLSLFGANVAVGPSHGASAGHAAHGAHGGDAPAAKAHPAHAAASAATHHAH